MGSEDITCLLPCLVVLHGGGGDVPNKLSLALGHWAADQQQYLLDPPRCRLNTGNPATQPV